MLENTIQLARQKHCPMGGSHEWIGFEEHTFCIHCGDDLHHPETNKSWLVYCLDTQANPCPYNDKFFADRNEAEIWLRGMHTEDCHEAQVKYIAPEY